MNLLKTQFGLDDLILEMMRVPPTQLRLNHLQDWMSRLALKDDLFDQHISFHPQTYQRKLLCRTPRFDMLILCWRPGQESTIHDHQESLNVTRVYRGQLTSRSFVSCSLTTVPDRYLASSLSEPGKTATNSTAAGSSPTLLLNQEISLSTNDLAVVDRHEIHQLANTSAENLVTLHVYARPLHSITVHCPVSGKAQPFPVQHTPE